MGQLKPGQTYIYEKEDGVTYAREAGADPNTRIVIGVDYGVEKNVKECDLIAELRENKMWGEIRRMAPTNPALQDALERVIVIYRLIKEESNKNPLFWHPV